MLINRDKRTKILRKPLSSRGREKAMRRRRKKLRIRNCEHKAGNVRTPVSSSTVGGIIKGTPTMHWVLKLGRNETRGEGKNRSLRKKHIPYEECKSLTLLPNV